MQRAICRECVGCPVIWMSYLSCTQQKPAGRLIHRRNFTEMTAGEQRLMDKQKKTRPFSLVFQVSRDL